MYAITSKGLKSAGNAILSPTRHGFIEEKNQHITDQEDLYLDLASLHHNAQMPYGI